MSTQTKLIEVTNEVTSKVFACERNADGETNMQGIDLPVQSTIDAGITAAIARALYLKMDADPKEETTLQVGPFLYAVTAKKVGETMTFNPSFSLVDEKKFLAELDSYEEKLSKNASICDSIAQMITDEIFVETVIHTCKLDEFDPESGEWVEKKSDADKGVEFDETSAKTMAAIHIAGIIHILVNSKNPDEVVSFEVPGEGTYTIERKKDKWAIGFVASKEFKQTIKNDRLVEALAK